MAIEFACPSCGGTLRVEDDAVGQVVRCGGCMTMLRVPDTVPSPSPPPFPGAPDTPFPGAEPLPPPPNRATVAKPTEERVPDDDRIEEPRRPPRRRRVRREPPPPTGRSPLFWIMITFGVLGVGSCIFCFGFAALMPKANWHTHKSRDGGFEVDLPSKPRDNMHLRGLKQDPKLKIEGTRVLGSGEEYAILYKDIEPTENREKRKENDLLAQTVKDLENAPGTRKIEENPTLQMCGFPAREIQLSVANGNTYVVRVIVADSRMYILVAGSRMNFPDEENIQHFFNSFKITDEKLVAKANDRTERIRKRLQRQEEEKQVEELGMALAETLLQTVAMEQEGTRVTAMGIDLANAPLQAILAEQERKHNERLRQERLSVAALGKALADTQFQTLIAEQTLVAEQSRIKTIGILIGKAVSSAIENALAKIDEP